MDAYDTIRKYAGFVNEVRLTEETLKFIIFKKAGRIWITAPEADFADLAQDGVVELSLAADPGAKRGAAVSLSEPPFGDMGLKFACDLLLKSKTYNAFIICKPVYAGICVDAKRSVTAVLDDMAQIIGPEAQAVPYDGKKIEKALGPNTAVLIENCGGAELAGTELASKVLVGGRNLYEAYTGLLVLEKSAEIILKSSVIGGVKTLSLMNRQLQHSKYLKSYSKTEKEYEDAAE
ncbi:MAG: hypothetical protein PUB39_01905 [Eubacteriales bacterium]|nr:hypothetical protein [Eubacteriales bacterium]